jgi:hypothetical protein
METTTTAEEDHLKHVDAPQGLEHIKEDMRRHFVSGGIQTEGDMNTVMHSTNAEAAPQNTSQGSSQMAHELQEMAEHHKNDESFVRGVAGLEFSYAEEEEDAE